METKATPGGPGYHPTAAHIAAMIAVSRGKSPAPGPALACQDAGWLANVAGQWAVTPAGKTAAARAMGAGGTRPIDRF